MQQQPKKGERVIGVGFARLAVLNNSVVSDSPFFRERARGGDEITF